MKRLVLSVVTVVAIGWLVGCDAGGRCMDRHRIPDQTALPRPCPLPSALSSAAADGLGQGKLSSASTAHTQDPLSSKLTGQFLNQLAACSVH